MTLKNGTHGYWCPPCNTRRAFTISDNSQTRILQNCPESATLGVSSLVSRQDHQHSMSQCPQPLFETFERFHGLNFLHLHGELPVVREFLLDFPEELQATESYLAVRGFLKSYAGNEATFNSYRTHAERLLLWSFLVAAKPLLALRRRDAEAFMDFCLSPPGEWVGPVVKSRFLRVGGRKPLDTDAFIINQDRRPFFAINS